MDPSDENICHLTDEQLKDFLSKYGESVALITPENRLLYENKLKSLVSDASSTEKSLTNDVNKPELVIKPKPVEADTYYGVFIPSHLAAQIPDDKRVYTNKTECLTLLKRYQGSRFKGFSTYDDAFCFSEYGPIVATVPSPDKPVSNHTASVLGEKSSPFRGPKSQELVKFRKAIEKANIEYFEECVNSNPRFLVSSGDTPAILQEGSRYNALHIACRNNKPIFCKKILSTISKKEFFQKLYPDDTPQISERRSAFLIDLYLNTPDKGLNETPLHFACKHGALECAKHLVSYPAADKKRPNKYGQSPFEIICTRVNKPDEALTHKLQDLFEDQFYVPVLRDEDNCHAPLIAPPWSPIATNGKSPPTPSALHGSSISGSPISPMFKVRGYAGPMSPQDADTFYSRWKRSVVPSPSRNDKGKLAALRLTDHEKGLERVGRDLASQFSVDWVEYWQFLDAFINITSAEGLHSLEEHLKKRYKEVVERRNLEISKETLAGLGQSGSSPCDSALDVSQDQDTFVGDQSTDTPNTTKSSLSSIGELCQDLEALRLNVSVSPTNEGQNRSILPKVQPTKPVKRKHSSSTSSCPFKLSKKPAIIDSTINSTDLPTVTDEPCNDTKSDPVLNDSKPSTNDNSALNDSVGNSVTEQYNFAVQSTRISSQRLASILGDISYAVSTHVGPDFTIARILRNKVKPEILSLKTVLTKSLSVSEDALDFGFVHVFLAAKTIENLMDIVSTSNLFLVSETLKLLVGKIDSFEESSSEDEDQNVTVNLNLDSSVENRDGMEHFRCVIRRMEKSAEIGLENLRKGSEDDKIDLGALEDCKCSWTFTPLSNNNNSSNSKEKIRIQPVDIKGINDSLNNNVKQKRRSQKSAGSGGRFSRAHSFLHRVLFGKNEDEKKEGKEDSSTFPVFKVFESVARQLSFEDKAGKEDNECEDTEDCESFTSAVSSLEDGGLMATPEEEVEVYINGSDPTKDDFDVFVAIDGLSIDGEIYPYVSEWLLLMETHSKETRERWPSSCCRARQVASSSPVTAVDDTSVKKILFPQSPI